MVFQGLTTVALPSRSSVSLSRPQQPNTLRVQAQQNIVQQKVQHITIQHNVYQQQVVNNISSPAAPAPPNEHQQFAEKFGSWFYTTLNGSNGASAEYGPQHFFPDCHMNVLTPTANGQNGPPEHYPGGEVVCKRLARYVQEDGVQFNPNTSREGTQGAETAHGVMLIKVCGTVHKQANVVGVFEQHFKLIRDPGMANNWRVKSTNLGLTNVVPQQSVTLAITGGLPALG